MVVAERFLGALVEWEKEEKKGGGVRHLRL